MKLTEFPDCCSISILHQFYTGISNYGHTLGERTTNPKDFEKTLKMYLNNYTLFNLQMVTLHRDQQHLEDILLKNNFIKIQEFQSKTTTSFITLYIRGLKKGTITIE